MQERYLPAQIQVEAAKEPLDIKVVKFSRKLDVFQIVGGAILTPFFPALEKKIDLRLVDTQRFGCGVVLLRYQKPAAE